jgi:hypothetical protein
MAFIAHNWSLVDHSPLELERHLPDNEEDKKQCSRVQKEGVMGRLQCIPTAAIAWV